MNQRTADPRATLRRAVYAFLIAMSAGSMIGRIWSVRSDKGNTPFLSANDRSRWCTIRALVDHGTYSIDDVTSANGWHTIDKVRHAGRDGQPHFYSSKPPLLPTLLAGQYWVIRAITGATLGENPFYVGRTMLVLTNVMPLIVYFALLASLVERWGQTDWGRVFVMAAATFGTFLTTYAVTLNNHLPAAVSVSIAVYAASRIWYDGQRRWWYFAAAGLFAAFAAANDLPALALVGLLGIGLLYKAPVETLVAYLPAVAIVAAGYFATNYAAHDTFQTPYAQRHLPGGWYDYEGSYWFGDQQSGIDRGEPSRDRYAFHVLAGHHGIVSLTPVWLLSAAGVALLVLRREQPLTALALLVTVLTVVCLVFYIGLRPAADRNYGGMTCGFRWMFWFIPLWLLAMLPAADLAATRHWARGVAIVLLALSAASASYGALNPWTHPWLYQYWASLGWL